MSACKSCHAAINWVSTTTGQRLPLDTYPVPDGTIMVLPNGRCRVIPVEEREACVAPLFRTHFATCPNAQLHRGPRGPRR